MALRKRFELASGIEVEYWRIVAVNADVVRGTVRVELLAWRNAAARNSGKQPIFDAHRVVELPANSESDLRLSAVYQRLVAQQIEIEPARVDFDPATRKPVNVPARTEPGFFSNAEDI